MTDLLWEDPVERQKKDDAKREEKELRLRSAIHMLSETQNGLELLRWILDECGVLFQDFPADATATAWHAGRRAFGLTFLSLCLKERLADTILLPAEKPTETA